jgi:hypothetical protein
MSPENKPSLINRSLIIAGANVPIWGTYSGLMLHDGERTPGAIMAAIATLATIEVTLILQENIKARKKASKASLLQKK